MEKTQELVPQVLETGHKPVLFYLECLLESIFVLGTTMKTFQNVNLNLAKMKSELKKSGRRIHLDLENIFLILKIGVSKIRMCRVKI